jgi:hypothetical protein
MDALKMSSLFWIEKLMKFVSSKIRYGGPKASLCVKNKLDGSLGLHYIYIAFPEFKHFQVLA